MENKNQHAEIVANKIWQEKQVKNCKLEIIIAKVTNKHLANLSKKNTMISF